MQIQRLHPGFAAEVTGLKLTGDLPDATIHELRRALEEHGVLVIRGQQAMTDDIQIAFCSRFGRLQRSITVHRDDAARRLRRDELSDISNVGEDGQRLAPDDQRRLLQKPARLWHSDNSFRRPPGLFTFLAAKILPPEGGNTEFADMRGAYEALEPAMVGRIANLKVRHSLGWSREQAGAPELSDSEKANIPESVQPLIRPHPASDRFSLYLSSHARDVIGLDAAEGRALLEELTAFATQPQFVYSHVWREGDVVAWDNRTTMHRATEFPEDRYRRDMRRTSVEDDQVAIPA